MKNLIVIVALLMVGTSVAAAEVRDARLEGRQTSSELSAPASKTFPAVAKNQTRPLRFQTEEIQELDPYGGTGTSSGSCVKKHYCSGGSICATGECKPDETKSGCTYCTGYKCKSMRCAD